MVSQAASLGAFPVARNRQNDRKDDIATKQRQKFVPCLTSDSRANTAEHVSGWAIVRERRLESFPGPAPCSSCASLRSTSFRDDSLRGR